MTVQNMLFLIANYKCGEWTAITTAGCDACDLRRYQQNIFDKWRVN